MQPNRQQLNPGFVTIEDAIKLIQSDKRNDAKVDLQFLVNNIPYMRVKGVYNIRKLKTVNNKVERDGEVYVTLYTQYDLEILKRAIQDAYSARTGIQFNPESVGVNYVSSVIDQEKNQMSGRPQTGGDPVLQPNEIIKEGASQVIQG